MLPPPDSQTSILSVSLDHVTIIPTSVFSTAAAVVSTTSDLFQIATINPTSSPSLISTATTSLVAAASTTLSSMPTTYASSGDDENSGECKLLGPFAILVQTALGALALLSLVFKRWRERPQRPIKIFAFDASKQVIGSGLTHVLNLLMSMFPVSQTAVAAAKAAGYQPNPCSAYLINLGIDTTFGIPILVVILRVLHVAFGMTPLARPPESIQSGNYGQPPRYSWWLKQSMIYFLGLIGMKACVYVIFKLFPWILKVGDWALKWTEGNEAIQIAFTMLIFPLIMNAIQYYIIDIFIKKKASAQESAKEGEEDVEANNDGSSEDDGGERGGLLAGADHGNSEVVDVDAEDETRKKNPNVTTRRIPSPEESESSASSQAPAQKKHTGDRDEYDPDKDGDNPTSHQSMSAADNPGAPIGSEVTEAIKKIPEATTTK